MLNVLNPLTFLVPYVVLQYHRESWLKWRKPRQKRQFSNGHCPNSFWKGILLRSYSSSGLFRAMPSGYTQHYLANERINPDVRNGLWGPTVTTLVHFYPNFLRRIFATELKGAAERCGAQMERRRVAPVGFAPTWGENSPKTEESEDAPWGAFSHLRRRKVSNLDTAHPRPILTLVWDVPLGINFVSLPSKYHWPAQLRFL